MKWVISLIILQEQTIAARLLQFISYLIAKNNKIIVQLDDFGAFGVKGSVVAQLLDVNRGLRINITQELLLEILQEDGQILEMKLYIETGNDKFEIIVADGSIIDILGDGDRLPVAATGEYRDENLSYYKF